MINIEENKKRFKNTYEIYKERIEIVKYPKEELEKSKQIDPLNKQNKSPEEIIKQQRLKMLKQKYEHTKRVVKKIETVNNIMNTSDFIKQLSQAAGLLHDYGRFIQAVYHNTYLDAENFYKENGYNGHGEVGYKILFEQKEIRYFDIDPKYYKLLGPVIKYHQISKLQDSLSKQIDENFNNIKENYITNTNELKEIDYLLMSFMIQIVKDADMYDILYQRIIGEYPLFSKNFIYHVNNMTIEEISKKTNISIEEIMKWNNLQTKDISNMKKIKLPFEKIEPELLEVPQQIKDKFFNKIYLDNIKEWDLRTMQNDCSYNYNSITAMWWTIGQFLGSMNFTSTLQMIEQENLLEQIYNIYPEKYKYLVKDMFEFAQKELLEKRIKKRKMYTKQL